MKKATKYAVNLGLLAGAGNSILNIIKQKQQDENIPFNWRELGIAFVKGGLVGLGTGYAIGSYVDYRNDKEKPVNTDAALFELINHVRLKKDDSTYQKLCDKADWLIQVIQQEFRGKIKSRPYRFGSTEKGTALKANFDVDVCISFKSGSFASTENMYYTLEEYIRKQGGRNGLITIRKQPKSIGVIFNINGQEERVDILPQKITAKRGNRSSGYIYVNSKGMFSNPSYTKTNPSLLSNIKLSEAQKNILIALKDWKSREAIPLSSHLLQYLILDAYKMNYGFIPKNISKKLIMVIKHIAENIDVAYITGIENTNNVITNIPASDKAIIKSACKKIAEEYEYQPNSLLNHFSI